MECHRWWHGNLDNPPAAGEVFKLPAGGRVDVEISSNKAHTSLGRGLQANPRVAPEPWRNENGWGSTHNPSNELFHPLPSRTLTTEVGIDMHASARNDVAGSALAIAYKSAPHDVRPGDFVVFSVVHDSPARQLETFQVPDLPACPNGRCTCAWCARPQLPTWGLTLADAWQVLDSQVDWRVRPNGTPLIPPPRGTPVLLCVS
jgi:hypothetical protein